MHIKSEKQVVERQINEHDSARIDLQKQRDADLAAAKYGTYGATMSPRGYVNGSPVCLDDSFGKRMAVQAGTLRCIGVAWP